MSANDASPFGLEEKSVARTSTGWRSSLTSQPYEWDASLGRQRHILDREAGTSTTDESGLLCYWRDDSPIVATPSFRRSFNLALKRVFDVVVASLAILALSPVFLVVAVALKLTDRGPVLFRQSRTGLDGKPFEILKFRTMYADRCDDSGVVQTVEGDDRVMPLGAILRRTSVDELPQLFNVVAGQMSLVGPRPHVSGQLAAGKPYGELVPFYDSRYGMRPGLTGWAQANGFRGPTEDAKRAMSRITHDMAYIQNFSFLLDLRILIKTVAREFFNGSGF